MKYDPHWLLLAGALGASLLVLRWARRWFWVFALLVLPGTVAHELCHYLLGLVLNGRPAKFQVVPRRQEGRYTLGSVAFAHLRWYNAFFVGMAPLLLLPAAWGLLRWRFAPDPLAHPLDWGQGLAFYLLVNLVAAALPSRQDFKVAARSPVGWVLLGAVLAWGWAQARSLHLPPRLRHLSAPR
jgi:hypothetical protein